MAGPLFHMGLRRTGVWSHNLIIHERGKPGKTGILPFRFPGPPERLY